MRSTAVMTFIRAVGALLLLATPVRAQQRVSEAAPNVAGATQGAVGARAAQASKPANVADRKVTLDLHNVTIADALQAIAKQASVQLVYSAYVVPVKRRVSVKLVNTPVTKALQQVLRGTGVKVGLISGDRIALSKDVKEEPRGAAADTATGTVLGHVVDSLTGRPLKGAVVSVKGTAFRFVTNDSGVYFFPVPAGVHTLTVRMLGYMQAEREVVVLDSQVVRVDIALTMSMSRLQELVTTATGKRRRLEVANDVTTIDVDSVMAVAPVTSVTDLLETRVPGLVVQHTTGAPGDPSRLRLRGVSSVYRSNDPIVIVDGVRVYAAQSDSRSGNLATPTSPAPSPLDQLDPNSIETIEVLKGPSAATLYGADAANGVIVITTKSGRPGPTRWTVSALRGRTEIPGAYPAGYYRFGRDLRSGGGQRICPLTDFACAADTLRRFQALNDPAYSVLGQGQSTRLSLGVSGGTSALTYNLTGSYADETGLLTLPDAEATRYRELSGRAPPEWMERPHQLTKWSGTSRLSARLGDNANASLTTALTRQTQQRSSLEGQLAALMRTYVDPVTGIYYRPSGSVNAKSMTPTEALVPEFYMRVTDRATNFTNAANLSWRPRSWLTTSADAGLNVISRQDELLRPQDLVIRDFPGDTLGDLSSARGSSVVSTVNLRAMATAPLPWDFRIQFATGANYTSTTIADLSTHVRSLVEGTSSPNGAGELLQISEMQSDVQHFGWYVQPSIAHKRFFFSAGLRFDGGSTFGSNVTLPTFPKLGGSWLISDESWFPLKGLFDVLRLRAAFGHAGVQPGPTDRLRLYERMQRWVNGQLVDVATITTLGNAELEPERSIELEGGFDADLLDNRLSVSLTGYRKTLKNALMDVPLAPSVYGGDVSVLRNIGVIRNTGLELTLGAQLLRTDLVTWGVQMNLSQNRNSVLELAPGVEPFNVENSGRVAPGYPLFGRWAKPILSYADVNGNGVIEESEVQLGDTLVYLGGTLPNYEASLHTTLSLFRGLLTVNASLAYQDGLTQVNQTVKTNQFSSRGHMDPSAPFGEQAAVVMSRRTDYGLAQTISTLRFNSLSVAYNAPPVVARWVGARSLSIALQGSNLGLKTDYTGKDPNVNAYATGNGVADTGVLPQPRSWLLTIRAGY